MSRGSLVSDQSGFTLVEQLVAIGAALVVIFGLTTVIMTTLHQSARVNDRVDATQRARLAVYQVIDGLHSACVAPQIAPVQAGSTGTSLRFLHQTGSEVAPTPVLSHVDLSGSTLSESVFPATGGSVPSWTFASTPSSTRQLMSRVASSPAAVPLLRLQQRAGLGDPAAHPAAPRGRGAHRAGERRAQGLARQTRDGGPECRRQRPGHGAPSLQPRRLQHQRQQPPMPLTARLRSEQGFTMATTAMGLFVVTLLVLATVTAVSGDVHLSRGDLDRKQAYEAAKAGINDYSFHLNSDNNYWTRCTTVPSPNAVNQQGSTARRRSVPGSTGATYAIELLPATG